MKLDEHWRIVKIKDGEKWLDTNYYISDTGKVYNYKIDKVLKTNLDKSGYERIRLFLNGKKYSRKIHRLVAIAFLNKPIHSKKQVNHINGIKTDNRVENLEWLSHSKNIKHAYDSGLATPNYGEDNGNSVLTEYQAHQICELLQDKYKIKTIIELLNLKCSKNVISQIKRRITWNDISSNYSFSYKSINKINDIKVRRICELLEHGFNDETIIDKLDFECSIRIVKRIRKRQYHTEISDNYIW